MPSESGERRLINYPTMPSAAPPDHHQPLPCPRCDSLNTKFCYYNNYNLAQPRHFCKSCRRYWTQGGTLRNVPVGGGTRKTAKRSRSISTDPISANPISSRPITPPPAPAPVVSSGSGSFPMIRPEVNLNIVNINASGGFGFTSLLNSHTPGFLALNAFSSGFDDIGYLVPEVQESISTSSSGGGGGNTWQLAINGEGGFGENECFTWPELGISTTPRRSVK